MKTLQKTTSIFLAIIFLLSSLGFTINKMACLKSGKIELSLVAIEDCCAKEEIKDACCEEENFQSDEQGTSITRSDCCEITNTSFDLSEFQKTEKNNIPPVSSNELILLPNTLTNPFYIHTSEKNIFADLSVPLHGRQLLSFISILII